MTYLWTRALALSGEGRSLMTIKINQSLHDWVATTVIGYELTLTPPLDNPV